MVKFQERNCKVVVVAHGIRESALKWLANTQISFPLLLDKDPQLYRVLGLRKSVLGVWRLDSVLHYAEEKVAGIKGSPAYEGDDLNLMGGDFIVDSERRLEYSYRSTTARDRPSVDDLLSFLSQ